MRRCVRLALSPLDIHNKEFSKGFFGYNEDEVNDFLDQIIKDYEIVLREKKESEQKVKELQEQLEHYSSIEGSLNQSILMAQETAEEWKSTAAKESKLIIKEAEKNADRIINEALEESRKKVMEIENIKRQAKVFRTRLKMLIEAQLDMIDNDDWDQFAMDNEEGND